jgi:hypothetical protein
MADSRRASRDPIAALLEFSEDYEQTPEEAEEELRAAGVDVGGFVGRLKTRLTDQADEVRLAWLTTARATPKTPADIPVRGKYVGMERKTMLAALKLRQTSSPEQAQAYFHKLDEVKDDDLRTLLTDLDDLDDEEDPT